MSINFSGSLKRKFDKRSEVKMLILSILQRNADNQFISPIANAKEHLGDKPLTDEIAKQVGEPRYADELAKLDKATDTTPPAEEKSFGDKALEVAGEVAAGAIKGVLGISEDHAGEMPPEHFQQINKEQAENKPFNPLDFDQKQDAWSRTHGAYEQVKEQTLDKEEQRRAEKQQKNQEKDVSSLSDNGSKFLKGYEQLRLKVYDDATGKDTNKPVSGATIGWGHLLGKDPKIRKEEFEKYKNGITAEQAEQIFQNDLKEHIDAVKSIKKPLTQNEFDALVIFSFNIGVGGFKTSSVYHILNGDIEKSHHGNDLEKAWKAFDKVTDYKTGKKVVSKGLVDRREKEYEIFKNGKYHIKK